MPSIDAVWTLSEAKAELSNVVARATSDGPQTITRNGVPVAVVVSIEDRNRKSSRKGTLAQFLMASPLRGAEFDLERVNSNASSAPDA